MRRGPLRHPQLAAFVLLGGVWPDRLPRHRLMVACDITRAAVQALSAVLILSGEIRVWELIALQAVYGAAEAFFGPASTALVPQTVRREELQRANAMLGLSGNVAAVLGPTLAGVLVATVGPGWGLAADAVTVVASASFSARCGSRPGRGSSRRRRCQSSGPAGTPFGHAHGCG